MSAVPISDELLGYRDVADQPAQDELLCGSLVRDATSDQGTYGVLSIAGITLQTIELPWRENKTSISHIPAGIYVCKYRHSQKFGHVWELLDVRGRTAVLIHTGNVAGDVALGFKTHSWGCILVGERRTVLWNQRAINSSKPAMERLRKVIGKKSFKLTITNSY